jgi:hypothetical protein
MGITTSIVPKTTSSCEDSLSLFLFVLSSREGRGEDREEGN